MRGRRVLGKQLALGSSDLFALAAQQLDPLVLRRPLEHGGIHRRAGLGKKRDSPRARIHAQGLGLVSVPDAAGAVLGLVDEVDGNGGTGIIHAGGEAFQDRDAARAHADDRDCRSSHSSLSFHISERGRTPRTASIHFPYDGVA